MPKRYVVVMSTVEKDPAKGLNAAMAATLNGERVASGMTFVELAAATGISKRQLIRLLSTTERDMNVDQIAAIAGAFGLSFVDVSLAAEKRLERHRKGGAESQGA